MNWLLVDSTGRTLDASQQGGGPTADGSLASLPPESQDELRQLLKAACADGARRRLSIMQPDRPLVVVDILPLRLSPGAAPPALIVVHDAAEFDGSYERLWSVARRNEAILRSSTDGVFVTAADCRFLEVNPAFCRMTGYTAAELLRMKISDLELDPRVSGGVASHTATGLHYFPTAHRHKSGHVVYLENTVNVLYDNGVKILVGIARDVTERKRAQDELARITREQQLILDSVDEGILGLDPTGKITLVNPTAAEMLDFQIGELIGRTAQDVFFPGVHRVPRCVAPSCPVCGVLAQESRSLSAESSFARRNGSRFAVEYTITAMYEAGKVVGAVLVFKNLTERQRAEQERRALEAKIQEAQKLESLGLLAGGIAHDLNNILAGVQGHASLALTDVPDGGNVSQRLHRIVGACERASKVIRNILTYSGHVTCDTAPLDLNELVESVSEFMRAAVPANVQLEFKAAATPLRVAADSGHLQQAISSLIVNAAEAIDNKPGTVTLSTGWARLGEVEVARDFPGQNLTPGLYAALHVDDDGCGMAPAMVDRIFEPFFSAKGAGRGLGLSAMHGVVRAHHGGVRVESQLGRGTRFTILLPALEQEVPAEEATASAERAEAPAAILVIDDEEEVREVMRDMLASSGWPVLLAADGAAGVELFRHQAGRIALVILDMTMPGLSGPDVFRQLVELRPEVRVIIASGYSVEPATMQYGEAEPVAYLTKPFAMNTLVETVSRVLGEDAEAASLRNPGLRRRQASA